MLRLLAVGRLFLGLLAFSRQGMLTAVRFVCLLWVACAALSEQGDALFAVGLVADNHYDTFPAGEQAPWEPTKSWLRGQVQRTTTTTKRRYDLAKDKMLEAVTVFNQYQHFDSRGVGRPASSVGGPRMAFSVNLGDLVNNDLMWNLRPILDAFNLVEAPKFSILGNHDLRGHNDRFGKNNKTQDAWMRKKLGLGRTWYYAATCPPFHFVFLDTQLHDEVKDPERNIQLDFLRSELQKAATAKYAVVIFAHIAIGLDTNAFGPIIKEFPNHVVAMFFGHEHKGGYVKQGHVHSVTLNGQIETLTNAFAIAEFFRDRIELTGFGRVPTRELLFTNSETIAMLKSWDPPSKIERHFHNLSESANAHRPTDPRELWSEPQQSHPPLNLAIPSYRKPLIPYAEPNPGMTRFLRAEYPQWARRVHTRAPEPPVELTSHANGDHHRPSVWLVDNAAASARPREQPAPTKHARQRPAGAPPVKRNFGSDTEAPQGRPTSMTTAQLGRDPTSTLLHVAAPLWLVSATLIGAAAHVILTRGARRRPAAVASAQV